MQIRIYSLFSLLLLFAIPSISHAALREKKNYTITSDEQGNELMESRGFGEKEGEVKMQNLMMVEGSGYEGMDMSTMQATSPPKNLSAEANSPHFKLLTQTETFKVGKNVIRFQATSRQKYTAQVWMTSMDMGTETPAVKEVKPGIYQFKADFSMKGPWAIKLLSPHNEQRLEFNVFH